MASNHSTLKQRRENARIVSLMTPAQKAQLEELVGLFRSRCDAEEIIADAGRRGPVGMAEMIQALRKPRLVGGAS